MSTGAVERWRGKSYCSASLTARIYIYIATYVLNAEKTVIGSWPEEQREGEVSGTRRERKDCASEWENGVRARVPVYTCVLCVSEIYVFVNTVDQESKT
jgi:hypothetical protein